MESYLLAGQFTHCRYLLSLAEDCIDVSVVFHTVSPSYSKEKPGAQRLSIYQALCYDKHLISWLL